MEINTDPTIINHIAFVVMFIGALFWYIYNEIKDNREIGSEEIMWAIIIFSGISVFTAYLWFIVIPIIALISSIMLLVYLLKKLAKALILVNAQRSDEKVEKEND